MSGELLGITAALLFALTGVSAKKSLLSSNLETVMLIGMIVNVVIYFTFFGIFYLNGMTIQVNLPGIMFFALSGLIITILGRSLSFSGYGLIGVSRTFSLRLTNSVFALILGFLFLGEMVGYYALIGIGLVVAGALLLVREQSKTSSNEVAATTAEETETQKGQQNDECPEVKLFSLKTKGIFFALLSGLSYATGDLFTKMGLQHITNPLFGNAVGGGVALVGYLIYLGLRSNRPPLRVPDMHTWFYIILFGVSSASAMMLTFAALRITEISIVVALRNVSPWFAIILGGIILGKEEKITWNLVGSTFLIVIGVYFITVF